MSGPAAEGMIPGCEDDVALVVRTLAGDRAAFGTLVQRYEEPVRRVARAVLHDVSDADDAAQDTFLTALMKLDRYDQRGEERVLGRVIGVGYVVQHRPGQDRKSTRLNSSH